MTRPELTTGPCAAAVTIAVDCAGEHRCPFVDEIDYGLIEASWQTVGHTVELHSLAALIGSYALTPITHEDMTAELQEAITATGVRNASVTWTGRTANMTIRATADALLRESVH